MLARPTSRRLLGAGRVRKYHSNPPSWLTNCESSRLSGWPHLGRARVAHFRLDVLLEMLAVRAHKGDKASKMPRRLIDTIMSEDGGTSRRIEIHNVVYGSHVCIMPPFLGRFAPSTTKWARLVDCCRRLEPHCGTCAGRSVIAFS